MRHHSAPATTKRDGAGEIVLPEVVESARRDYRGHGTWSVEIGAPARGEAWTDLDGRRLRVPAVDLLPGNVGGGAAATIRAHELAHVRLSPVLTTDTMLADIAERWRLPLSLIMASEEVRVNRALKDIGFDLAHLTDGTEREAGSKAYGNGTPEEWNNALDFFVALSGTPAQTVFARGIAKSSPEWRAVLREVEKTIKKRLRNSWHETRTGTETWKVNGAEDGAGDYETYEVPSGFMWTLDLANELSKFRAPAGSSTEGMGETAGVGKEFPQGNTEGTWTPLVFDSEVVPTVPVRGALLKRRVRPSNTGASVRYASRMLTDSERRVFGGTRKDVGGVVVVDVSGSMSLSEHDLERILDAAPMATVFAYSAESLRRRKGAFTTPNAWLLSWNGKRIEDLKAVERKWLNNGGNGCDGPAVAHAVAVAGRRSSPGNVPEVEWRGAKGAKGVPVVWVTDGAVTDCTDSAPADHLLAPLVDLVHRANVIITPHPTKAVEVLKAPTLSRAYVEHSRLRSRVRKSHGGRA